VKSSSDQDRSRAPPERSDTAGSHARERGHPPAKGLFIAGTDTGVGKTRVAVSLIAGLAARGVRVAAMKPVAAGAELTPEGLQNEDARLLAAAANVRVAYAMVNPYCLRAPVSPHIAAEEAGIVIDPALIRTRYEALAAVADRVIVEGAGGWLAPIGAARTMEDVAVALGLPVVLVVGLRLGCLSHALLTARAIRASGLPIAHWVGNAIDPAFERSRENIATLSAALGPPLATLAFSIEPRYDRDTISVSL